LSVLQRRLDSQTHLPTEQPSAFSQSNDDETPSKILCPSCGMPMTFQRNLTPKPCRSP
jgi:hypothetical protein